MTDYIVDTIGKTVDSIRINRISIFINYLIIVINYYIRITVHAILEYIGYMRVIDVHTNTNYSIWNGIVRLCSVADIDSLSCAEDDYRFYIVTFYSKCVKYRAITYCKPLQIIENIYLMTNNPSRLDRTVFADIMSIRIKIDGASYSTDIQGWDSNLTVFADSVESMRLTNIDWIKAGLIHHMAKASIDIRYCDMNLDIVTLDSLLDDQSFN